MSVIPWQLKKFIGKNVVLVHIENPNAENSTVKLYTGKLKSVTEAFVELKDNTGRTFFFATHCISSITESFVRYPAK